MSEERIYRNEACPCGSGRKFKKCCYNRQGKISPLDRAMAIDCLEQYVEHCDERADALTLFRAGLDVDAPAMKGDFQQASDQAFLLWFAFDYLLTDGCFVVDHALAANPLASPGERLYLEQMKQTAIAPYEVLSIRPGHSVTMRQVCGHREIEVREKTASHTLKRWDLLAVRVNPVGPTGGPEMEMGVLWLPQTMREHVTTLVQDNLQGHPEGPESIMVLKALGASLHQLWLRSIVDPQVPQIRTADSQPMVWTTLWFEVHDPARVEEMLNACRSLEAGSNYWNWIVDGTMLGTIELLGPQLTFDIPTQSQADNGRRFLEGIAGDLITHTRNEITDVTEELRRRIRNGELPEAHPDSMQEVPAKVQDELTQEYFSKYYLEWLDDSIPALDNKSPRYAAKSTRLCARLIDLLKDMENMYLRALTQGDPAFDPTWMWDELGLSDHQDAPGLRHPCWLAHETMGHLLPETRQIVENAMTSLHDAAPNSLPSIITKQQLQTQGQVQELFRSRDRRLTDTDLLSHLEFYCNYELHLRKTFWVDESLAWMLSHTQIDATGDLFRLPFPCYVLAYTDRHTLGIAERALAAGTSCDLRGQMLAVVCAYVLQLDEECSRVSIGLTADSLAGQPPHLMRWELHITPDGSLETAITDALTRANTPCAEMFRPLLDAVLNATIYSTSAGIKLEQYHAGPTHPKHPNSADSSHESGEVYYLPGAIPISQLRLQRQLERRPSGRELLHRYLVRGHWRRPNPNWKDQKMRWIEPHWRGPSLASIVERAYRLMP